MVRTAAGSSAWAATKLKGSQAFLQKDARHQLVRAGPDMALTLMLVVRLPAWEALLGA